MASRIAARYISRRLSSGGKILSEEEKAAENIYIKKIEQEKLEKLARKGPAVTAEAPVKPETPVGAEKPKVDQRISADKNRNYAVAVGALSVASAFGWWYLSSKTKKSQEIVD